MTLLTNENIKKENWFVKRTKNYQIITFTFAFLFIYRFALTLILYFTGKENFLESYNLSSWFFIIGIPITYFLQWLLVTWVASKYTFQSLKEKFYRHPIATIIFAILYILDLPRRLTETNLGSGLLKLTNAFEIIIYYAFLSFFQYLLICWISEKIWKEQKFTWNWYKKLIDKVFIIFPAIYKFVLGLIVALFIFLILFLIATGIFHYSGSDLRKLGL